MSAANTEKLDGANGLRIAATCYGDEAAQTVILAHGGGQTRRAWGATALELANLGYRTIAIDLRGHGESEWCQDGDYRIETFARDYLEIARRLPSKPILVGASLGGIAAMVAAGEMNRAVFRAVVLVDVTPHMESAGIEKIIGFMNAHIERGFGSVAEAAEVVSAYLPHRPKPKNLRGLEQNLRKRNGRYFWHWDPKFVNGSNRPSASRDPERLAKAVRRIEAPIMLVRGRMSELVSQANVEQFMELVPDAHYVDIADAHHMVAGDRNDAFTDAIKDFVQSLE